MTPPVLIADTSEPAREQLKNILADHFPLIIVESPAHALEIIKEKRKPCLILMGIDKSSDTKGKSIFSAIRKHEPEITLIALGERNNESEAVEAVRMGASGYMMKPPNPMEILSIARKNAA